MELWFAIYSGWSGQVLFENWTIAAYNVVSKLMHAVYSLLFRNKISIYKHRKISRAERRKLNCSKEQLPKNECKEREREN